MERQGHRDRSSTERRAGLETCPQCERPFVVPVALLDLVDDGIYLLALECKNCGRLAVGQHEDAEVERLEREMLQASTQIEAAADLVEVARLVDTLSPLRDGLVRDLLRPEDL